MALPSNTGTILNYLFPDADFESWEVFDHPENGIEIRKWNLADPQPTEQEVIDAGNSSAYDDWLNVPTEVTNYQLKQALNTNPADRAAVEALVDASTDQNIKDGWLHALQFKADNPLFQGAIANLGWTQETVNNYLKLAATFD